MEIKGSPLIKACFAVILFVIGLGATNTLMYAEIPSQQATKQSEAWQQALLYSKDHSIITFAVYGRTTDATARENAEKIKQYLAKHQITSRYFLEDEQDIGSSVGFYIQGVQYGPKSLSQALPLIKRVISDYKQEYRNFP